MIASTSHDMKTPLNSILSMVDLIEQKTDEMHILEWLRIAKISTLHLVTLVQDTLDFFLIR